uniref:Uncharacterized protein n=1 Tax=Opuntia streptacantha TaxID=393608 RepID=A0A7C9DTP4_OPUST
MTLSKGSRRLRPGFLPIELLAMEQSWNGLKTSKTLIHFIDIYLTYTVCSQVIQLPLTNTLNYAKQQIIAFTKEERMALDGQQCGKLLYGHTCKVVIMHIECSSICLTWWILIARVLLKEDYIVICSPHTHHFKLMPTSGSQLL